MKLNKMKLLKKLIFFVLIKINIYNLYYSKYNHKNPKISIFLPVYNKELYLKNSIESLQKQNLKDIEIVAVNDGSTDNSLKILKKLSKLDRRIKIINNDRNHGLLYSRAMGITNSTGNYLMNLDPDDKLISNNDLSSLYKMSKKEDYDIIIYLIKRIAVNQSDYEYFKYLDDNQLIFLDDHITNKLIKKEVYLKAYNEFKENIFSDIWNFHEDNIWSFLVRRESRSIGILNKSIYYYKRNKDSLNTKVGNLIELKNRFDRLIKFEKIDYDIVIKMFKKYVIDNFQFSDILKNFEIKKKIFNALINSMKLYRNQTNLYNEINLILHKLSQNKIIIFYNDSNIDPFLNCIDLNEFNNFIEAYKHIISINISEINAIIDVNNYIYSNDTLFFLNNSFFYDELKPVINSHKENKFVVLVDEMKNISEYKLKKLKIYTCK